MHPSIRACWLLVPVALIACVGDTPTTTGDAGPAQGTEGGACFPNGTCNTGLVCVVPNRCEKPGTDGGGSDADGGSPSDASPDAPADCKLMAWWRADNDTNDVKATYNLTWFGAPAYTGNAFDLTGTNFLKSTTPFSTPSITVEAKINPSAITGGTIFATEDYGSSGPGGVWFGLNQGKLSARINKLPCSGTATLAAAIPHHVAFTYGSNQCAFYLDGIPDGTPSITAGAIADKLGPHVGAEANLAATTDYFTGTIDNLAVWSKALSAGEISSLAKENPAVKCQ